MDNYWDEAFGDRRQEIVFIGLASEMSQQAITARLNACLVEDFSLNSESTEAYRDPFFTWFQQAS